MCMHVHVCTLQRVCLFVYYAACRLYHNASCTCYYDDPTYDVHYYYTLFIADFVSTVFSLRAMLLRWVAFSDPDALTSLVNMPLSSASRDFGDPNSAT